MFKELDYLQAVLIQLHTGILEVLTVKKINQIDA
jgi:hypothetical protein